MSALKSLAVEGLRPFQRKTVERVWASLHGDQGTGRFLVADEVGLGKTRVAAALVRQFEATRRSTRGQIVVYFAPNAEIARQNLRILRLGKPSHEPRARLTLLPLFAADLQEPGTHVLGFTPGTSLSVSRGTGTAEERALLLALLRPVWRCGESDVVVDVLRDRARRERFRAEMKNIAQVDLSSAMATAFRASAARHPEWRDEFTRLRHAVTRGELPRREHRARRKLIGRLRHLLAEACLTGLAPKLVVLDEFQRFSEVLRNADDPNTLEHVLMKRSPVLMLSATPYRMTADQQDPGSQVDLARLLRFLLRSDTDAGLAEHELEVLRRSFHRLKPRDDPGHGSSVEQVRTAKGQVEARLAPVMSRWQRPPDDEATMPLQLIPTAADIRAYLAFQRVVDRAAEAVGLRHRMTVEYWKSAPYLMTFMRGYRVKQAIDAAWKDDAQRRAMQRVLRASAGTALALRDVAQYRPVPVHNARYRALKDLALEHDQWRALWVPPAFAPYRPHGRFAGADAARATKTLVFSGWRVVPTSVASLIGYEAEQRSGVAGGETNTRKARQRRGSAQLLSPRYDTRKGLQRMPVLGLVYPSCELAAVDPYEPARRAGEEVTKKDVLDHAIRTLRPQIRALRRREHGNRVDVNWYWAAPMLLDIAGGHDVDALLRAPNGLRRAWRSQADDADGSKAVDEAVRLARRVLSGEDPLGRQPPDLTRVVAQLSTAAPAVTALRALTRLGPVDDVVLAAARMGWGLRTLLNRPDATLVVRTTRRRKLTGDAGAYWRDALDYCVEGALQGVVDEFVHLLLDEHGRPGLSASTVANRIAMGFTATTDLQPLAIAADAPQQGLSARGAPTRRRLTSRFAVAFGSARTEEDAGVHPEFVRQAFNSPFWPWVLVTTSVGQEGLDFHRYCHQLVHWNVPATPVELEQREGRVIRFFNHAVRRNIAERYADFGRAAHDPWHAMLAAARQDDPDPDGFRPEWVLPGGSHRIKRIAPMLAYSRDHQRFERVQRARVYYRLVLGQPNPQELVEAVMTAIPLEVAKALLEDGLALNLEPKP